MGAVDEYISGQESGKVTSRDRFFTVSKERAIELVSKHQLARQEHAVLKFVQACDQGACGLTLVGDHGYEFWGWRGGSVESLRTRLLHPLAGLQDDALGSLVIGINSLRTGRQLVVESFPTGQISGWRLSLQPSKPLGALERVGRPSSLSPHQSVLKVEVLQDPLSEKAVRKLLSSKCPFARIRFRAAEKQARQDEHSLTALRQKCSKNWEPAEAQRHSLVPSWFVVEASTLGSGTTVRLLKNGVILEETTEPGISGPTITICADHLRTDLSGLQFLKTEQKDELKSQVLGLPTEVDLKVVGLSSTRPKDVAKPVALLSLLYTASICHLLALAFGVGDGELELVNLIASCFLINLVEYCGPFRESRKRMPLPSKARIALHISAALSSLTFFYLWTSLGVLSRPRWFVPEFLFFLWLPLVANTLLNPEPNDCPAKSDS